MGAVAGDNGELKGAVHEVPAIFGAPALNAQVNDASQGSLTVGTSAVITHTLGEPIVNEHTAVVPTLAYYGKRSADAEPEAKADPYLLYGGYGLGYRGYGYGGYYGHGYGYGYPYPGYGYGYAPYAYAPYRLAGAVSHQHVSTPAATYGVHQLHKREAEADAEPEAYYGRYGYGYPGYGYGYGYARYGYRAGYYGYPYGRYGYHY